MIEESNEFEDILFGDEDTSNTIDELLLGDEE